MNSEEMTSLVDQGVELISNFGIQLIIAIIIYIVGKWVVRKVANLIGATMEKRDVDVTVARFVTNLLYSIGLIIVIIAALGQVGIQTTSFIAILGAAGLAVGLALQGSLSNFASGVLMLLFRPIKVGDFVNVAGESGTVEEISIFVTKLNTPDNKVIIVPNSGVMSNNITNFSTKPTRRVDMVFGCSYSDDLQKVKRVLQELVEAESRILKDPAYTIAVSELADSSVNFVVRPWVNAADYWGVYFDMMENVKVRFDQEGIGIPFPQVEVHQAAQA